MRIILTAVFVLVWAFASYSQLTALKEKITIRLKNVTAVEVIRELDKQSTYTFSYTRDQLEKIPVASFAFNNITLGKALENLQQIAGLEFNLLGTTIAVKAGEFTSVIPKEAPATGKPGRLTGVIRNEKNEVMPGVSVMVERMNRGTTTSVNGDYVLTLPPGSYILLISFVGYQPRRITDVVIKENDITDLSVVLSSAGSKQLQAVVVTSGARRESTRSLLMAQKNSASMTNGISAEQIRVTPDNNTGQVLKRVSGITVQNDKFVTIRGISDRYNNVLINGASLPSTEPNRRNFSFDIVPSALVDNIVVNKTATPDLPSEFTGGMVQINTKDVPLENFLDLTIGTGFNSASMGKQMVGFKRDDKAPWGKVDESRKWFGDGRLLDPVVYNSKVNRDKDTTFRNATGRKVPNRWQNYQYPYTPVRNFQMNGGMGKRFKAGNSLGFIGSVTYRNEQLYEEGESRVLQQSDFETQRYRYTTAIGALLNTAYKSKQHKLAWKNLYNHRYSNQFDMQTGAYITQGWYGRRTGEVTLTNDMLLTRLEGEHQLFGKLNLKADWYGEYVQLIREQPDTRFITGNSGVFVDTMGFIFQDKGTYTYDFNNPTIVQNSIYSSRLEEKKKNGGIHLSLPFNVGGSRQLFKTGASIIERNADFDGSGFKIRNGNGTLTYTDAKRGLPYYDIVTPEAFANGDLEYFTAYARSETTGDRYEGEQKLKAWYGMVDLKFLKDWRVTGGIRYEENRMNMNTVFYTVNGFAEFRDTLYQEKDWLPSVNLIYSVTDKFNIRAAFSKTLARPDFVERSPYVYYDFVELAEVVGEKKLETSRIDNYDLRFEYYPSGNEILSASVFYKKFDKPVERFYNIGSAVNSIQYKNLHSATAKGIEAEIRKSLSFISPATKWLGNLYISSNFSYLKGEISYEVTRSPLTQKDTSFIAEGKRPIQGLSPYIINAGLNYQDKVWGFNIAYNRYGRRIVNGGTNFPLIQFENPRDIMDLQLSMRFMKQKAELKCNVSDILNQYYIIYSNNVNRQGTNSFPGEMANDDPKGESFNEAVDLVNYKVKRGTGFSINLSYKL